MTAEFPNPAHAIGLPPPPPHLWLLAPSATVSLRPVTRDNPGEMDGRMASPTLIGRVEELQTDPRGGLGAGADVEPAVVLLGARPGWAKLAW